MLTPEKIRLHHDKVALILQKIRNKDQIDQQNLSEVENPEEYKQ